MEVSDIESIREEVGVLIESDETKTDVSRLEAAVEAVSIVAKKYQAGPAVMDSTLEWALRDLLNHASSRLIRAGDDSPKKEDRLIAVCNAVYELCAARGSKKAVKWFPHETSDLEAAFRTLQQVPIDQWRTRYTLLLWLALLAKNPFDVESVVAEGRAKGFAIALEEVCETTFKGAGPPREAAALCLATVVTRRDVEEKALVRLVDRVHKSIHEVCTSESSEALFMAIGSLSALAASLKLGERGRSRAVARTALEATALCFEEKYALTSARPLRKLAVKLAGRIGSSLLPPAPQTWCYARGRRTLLVPSQDIKTEAVNTDASNLNLEDEESNDDDDELLDENELELLEEIIERLLGGTRDPETSTRWTAAKALGRVAARLGRSTADELVSCVLQAAAEEDDDCHRHGAALALAELARLGVLLPCRLEEAVAALKSCVVFEKRAAGGAALGAHVRDASCYAVWAFARAYEPRRLAPHLPELAATMLTVALLDREVHVRRAAAAALQEHIGRQGHANFVNGIKLSTLCDFFAVGNRDRAYLEIAPKVAALDPNYKMAIIRFLLDDRLRHWDQTIRALAAAALPELLSADNVENSKLRLLEELRSRSLAPDVGERHGALAALASLLPKTMDLTLKVRLEELIPELESKRLYRGRGGELVRVAACRFIGALLLPLPVKQQLRLLDTLDECAVHAVEEVREAAAAALEPFAHFHFGGGSTTSSADLIMNLEKETPKPPSARLLQRTVVRYLHLLATAPSASISRGMALYLGSLPSRVLEERLPELIQGIASRARQHDTVAGERDAETRRDAIKALRMIVRKTSISKSAELLTKVLEVYALAGRDYGADKRGDVGSWARAEALQAFLEIALRASDGLPKPQGDSSMANKEAELLLVVPSANNRINEKSIEVPSVLPEESALWEPGMAQTLVDLVIRQLGEKLDSVREAARKVLERILTELPGVPERSALRVALDANDALYTKLAQLISTAPVYTSAVLGGIVVTAGSGDSRAADAARMSLLKLSTDAAEKRDFSTLGRLARGLSSLLDEVCCWTPAKSTSITSTSSDDDQPAYTRIATCSALSKEEAARAYLPVLKMAATLLDSGSLRVLLEPPPIEARKRLREQLGLPEEFDYQPNANSDKSNGDDLSGDDPASIASKLVATLARIAASKRAASNVRKTAAVVDALLASSSLCATFAPANARKAIAASAAHLASPMPRARAHVAEQLYGRLLDLSLDDNHSAFSKPRLQCAIQLLGQVDWVNTDTSLTEFKMQRDSIGIELEIESQLSRVATILDARNDATKPASQLDELESYANLVKDAGY